MSFFHEEAVAAKNTADFQKQRADKKAAGALAEKKRADTKATEALAEKKRSDKQLTLTRHHLFVAQLQRVAAVMERDPANGYELLSADRIRGHHSAHLGESPGDGQRSTRAGHSHHRR